MRYLITGGTGFLGAYVCRQLLKKGEEVVIYDWKIKDSPAEIILTGDEMAKLKMVQGDVCDIVSLLNTARQYEVRKVVHLAGILAPLSEANPSLAQRVNCEGTNNVFEAARILGLEKVVWVSSNAVFGQYGLGAGTVRGQAGVGASLFERASEIHTLDEDSPHRPVTVYGATKSLCEFMGKYYAERWQLDIIGLRLGRTIGLGKVTGGGRDFAELIWKVAKNHPAVIPNAEFVRPYDYVEDLARAFVLASEAGKTKTRLFCASGFEQRTNRELGEILKKLNPGADITVEPTPPGAYRGYRIDCSRIQEELKFFPKYSLEQALKIMIEAFRGMATMEERVGDKLAG